MADFSTVVNSAPALLVDWENWTPVTHATLVFVLRGDEVLLIRKKRGLGAGKINGPGGRLEPGESPLDCAIREVEEELCITPTDLEACGELAFQFTDGYSLVAHVFIAHGFEGEPAETDEAAPLWTPIAAMPYGEMWADDELWFPLLLAGVPFRGRFLFDGDTMLTHEIVTPAG
jgi:8-oxo-dGTP diphosphatase